MYQRSTEATRAPSECVPSLVAAAVPRIARVASLCETVGGRAITNEGLDLLLGHAALRGEMTLAALIQDFVHDDDRAAVREAIDALRERGAAASLSCRVQRSGGSMRHVLLRGERTADGANGEPALVVTLTDVTEREQLLLRRSQQQAVLAQLGVRLMRAAKPDEQLDDALLALTMALDARRCAIFDLSDDGAALLLRRMHGARCDAWTRQPLPADGSHPMGMALVAGEPVVTPAAPHQCRSDRRDLRALIGRASICVTIPGAAARPLGVLAVFDDRPRTFSKADADFLQSAAHLMSAAMRRGQIEAGLQDQHERLEAAIDHAAALKRINDGLSEAHLAARTASHHRGEFLTHISHELRTPLTAILGYVDLLLDDPAGGRQPMQHEAAVGAIRRNSDHLLTLVNDLLDLAKVDEGKLTIEHVVFAPAEVLADVANSLELRAAAKGIGLEVIQETPLPGFIRSDPTRLRQVLMNLVGNAIKFTKSGGVRVEASWTEDCAGGMLRMDVVDTGIGLSAAELERIFTPFAQADDSIARRFGGTGLGLAISRRLAGLLGGELTATSTPGQGSRFRFSMRAAAAALSEGAEPSAAGRLPDSHVSLDGVRVLLAEDGPDTQRLIEQILSRAGAEVVVVENGALAVEAALANRPGGRPGFDVVLMDLQMPVLDGIGATKSLRSRGYRGAITALTAHAMAGSRALCQIAGFDDFVTKPVTRGRLISHVGQMAGRLGPVRRDAAQASPVGVVTAPDR